MWNNVRLKEPLMFEVLHLHVGSCFIFFFNLASKRPYLHKSTFFIIALQQQKSLLHTRITCNLFNSKEQGIKAVIVSIFQDGAHSGYIRVH